MSKIKSVAAFLLHEVGNSVFSMLYMVNLKELGIHSSIPFPKILLIKSAY